MASDGDLAGAPDWRDDERMEFAGVPGGPCVGAAPDWSDDESIELAAAQRGHVEGDLAGELPSPSQEGAFAEEHPRHGQPACHEVPLWPPDFDGALPSTAVPPMFAAAVASGPVRVGGARAPNPVGELQDRVAFKLGRSVATGDIEYVTEAWAHEGKAPRRAAKQPAGKGEGRGKAKAKAAAPRADPARFICKIRIPVLGDDHPEISSRVQPSKREAKRCAAEAALTDPQIAALLPQRPRGKAVAADEGQETDTAAPLGPGAADMAAKLNAVGELQEALQRVLRRPSISDAVKYTVRQDKAHRFTVSVHITHAAGTTTYTSKPNLSKRSAKREVAEAALAGAALIDVAAHGPRDPAMEDSSSDGTSEEDEDDDQWLEPKSSHLCILQQRLQQHLQRPVQKGDIIVTYAQVPSPTGGHNHFVATVQVNSLEGEPACCGCPCATKRRAKNSAAQALLLNPDVSEVLPTQRPRRKPAPAPPQDDEDEDSEDSYQLPPGFIQAEEVARNNKVSKLNEKVQKVLRRPGTSGDVKYEVKGNNKTGYVATVFVPSIEGCPPVSGPACHSKRLAQRAAAEAALQDPGVRAAMAKVMAQQVRRHQVQAAHPRPPGLGGFECDPSEPEEDEEEELAEEDAVAPVEPEPPLPDPAATFGFKEALKSLPPITRGAWPRPY